MANYKMILQYDGTRYRGWQVLPAELTVQGKLQDVLSKMAGYQVEVTGSGRTDAGVHAKGQTANFHLREEWDEVGHRRNNRLNIVRLQQLVIIIY